MSDPGSSTRASGLPPVCLISRSRTSSATGTPPRSVSNAAAAAASMPPTTSSGNSPLSNRRTSPSRAANSSATRSGPSLRATKSNAAVEASSSQCASSMTHSTGDSSAASASRLSVARKTRNRSPGRGVGFPERRPQRCRLPRGEVFDVPHHRAQQPLQRGERQRRLRLDALGPQHLHARLDIRSQRGPPGRPAAPTSRHPAARGPPAHHPGSRGPRPAAPRGVPVPVPDRAAPRQRRRSQPGASTPRTRLFHRRDDTWPGSTLMHNAHPLPRSPP